MSQADAVIAAAPRLPRLLAGGIIVAGILVAVLSPAGLTAGEARAAGLALASLGLWATGALPESLTALLFFTAAMLAGVAPPATVFAGLASSAFWLVFSGLILGAAIRRSGLGDRIAAGLATALRTGFRRSLVGVVLFGLAMAFLMPSAMGRVVLLAPILAALAERLGHARHSRGHRGLVLGGVLGTVLPSFAILPANVPNNVLAGMIEAASGAPLAFGDYLLLHFPVLGAAKTLVVIAVLLALYRPEPGRAPAPPAPPVPPPTAVELRMAAVLAIALVLWATDSLHHISPAWIGMAAAVACLAPPLGLLPPRTLQTINLEPLLYVGGIIGLGALIAHAGLGQRMAAWALQVVALEPGRAASNFAQLCGMSTLVGVLTTLPGVPAVLTPLAGDLAAAAGITPAAVLITQVVGFSTAILPYQAPPLVMAMQVGDLPRREVVRAGLMVAAVTVAVLWPLDFLWLTVLGRF